MRSDRSVVVGRSMELAAVEEFAGAQALLVVRGDDGIGKSTLLGEFDRAWRKRGFTVLSCRASEHAPEWDVFGAQAVIDLVRDSFHEFDGARLASSIAAISNKLCHEQGGQPAQDGVFAELVRLFKKLRSIRPVALLVDDVDEAPDPVRAIAAAYRAGCTVVATCREGGIAAGPTSLLSLADRVIDLGPLRPAEVGELLARATPVPLDEAVVPTMCAALGPLAGNPGAVLATFEALRGDDGFTVVHDRLCLRDPDPSAIALQPEHVLVRHVEGLGQIGVELVAMVAGTETFGVDDVLHFADAAGYELARCGEVVDLLVAGGALTCAETGQLSVPCAALAAALVRRIGTDQLRALHRAMAEQLLRSGIAEAPAIAEHITLAGTALRADPSLIQVVEREAAVVARSDARLAARWFRAALRHAGAGAGRVPLLRVVLHLLARTGQYAELAETVESEIRVGAQECCRYELAASAALAAVHIGRPLTAEVYEALADDRRARLPLAFAARWFDERWAVRPSDVAEAFSAFRVNRVPDWEPDTGGVIEAADDQYDVVAMFKLVLGPCYGEPESGPIGVYRRLLREYADGDWRGAVSSARRLELFGERTAMHDVSRLLAAEIHSSCGDFRNAELWLGLVGDRCPFPALRNWVDLGVRYRTCGEDLARGRGWVDYDRISLAAESGGNVGLPWFLLRLGLLEHGLGNGAELARTAAEARRWYRRFGGRNLHAAELVLRGLSEKDDRVVLSAVKLLRQGGHAVELMRACVAVAYVSDDPAPWYAEALNLAKRLGAGWMDLRIKETMRRVGYAPPRARAARDDFSEVELKIIAHVRQGRTNRQIATALRMSEKTVENYLTRLFTRTGCRSRLDLATASLEGRLASAGSVQRS